MWSEVGMHIYLHLRSFELDIPVEGEKGYR